MVLYCIVLYCAVSNIAMYCILLYTGALAVEQEPLHEAAIPPHQLSSFKITEFEYAHDFDRNGVCHYLGTRTEKELKPKEKEKKNRRKKNKKRSNQGKGSDFEHDNDNGNDNDDDDDDDDDEKEEEEEEEEEEGNSSDDAVDESNRVWRNPAERGLVKIIVSELCMTPPGEPLSAVVGK
jgi:hypothetical protein